MKNPADMTTEEMIEVVESGRKSEVDQVMNYLLQTGQIVLQDTQLKDTDNKDRH